MAHDDYSRAIAGFYLYFEAPSALQTALTLREAIWYKADSQWLICGIPDILYTDHEAVTAIVNTTRGNFRLFHRLFTQIKRVMQVNDAKTVTREIVQAARDCLVIGV